MVRLIAVQPTLCEALKKVDFELPEECTDVQLLMPVDGVYQLTYTVNLTPERIMQVGRALELIGKTGLFR